MLVTQQDQGVPGWSRILLLRLWLPRLFLALLDTFSVCCWFLEFVPAFAKRNIGYLVAAEEEM